MNEILSSRYVESIQRLALGIECRDPMLEGRIGWPVEVRHDGIPHAVPSWRRAATASRWQVPTVPRIIARSDSCRHVVLLRPTTEEPIDLRIADPRERFVPRRLSVRLDDPIGSGRVVRPAMYPGATYPIAAGAVGMRGRVVRDEAPMRWARVEARRTSDDAIVGRAHGDEHGEFLLLLDAEASRGADLILPLTIRITVFGPDTVPDPDDFDGSNIDPLWDLPVEEVEVGPTAEEVLSGARLPSGYVSRPGSTREVDFGWHGLVREEFDFS